MPHVPQLQYTIPHIIWTSDCITLVTVDKVKLAYITWNRTNYHNVISTKDIISGDIAEGNNNISAKWKRKAYAANIVKLGKYIAG